MPPSSATAYQSLQAFKPRSNDEIMNTSNAKYDIAGSTQRLSSLRGLVGNLQSSVEAVDPSVTGRTSGNFVTEGQRSALVNKEQAPILGSLAKQQGALGQEQQSFQTSSTLASQMASALMSQDKDAYSRLLDQYNAATASEAEAERKRQYNETLAEQKRQFDEQKRQFNERQKSDARGVFPNLGGNNSKAAAAAAQATNNTKVPDGLQALYNQVFLKKNGSSWGDRELVSDYNSTRKGAGNGNLRDRQKLELYHSVRPDLFGSTMPASVLANGSELRY